MRAGKEKKVKEFPSGAELSVQSRIINVHNSNHLLQKRYEQSFDIKARHSFADIHPPDWRIDPAGAVPHYTNTVYQFMPR